MMLFMAVVPAWCEWVYYATCVAWFREPRQGGRHHGRGLACPNRASWDERVPVHLAAPEYDLAALRAGRRRLDVLAKAIPPPLAGLQVLHLRCHFGRDTLVLAGRGADVMGLDFSAPIIAAAQALAAELRPPARFVLADVHGAPAAPAKQPCLPCRTGEHATDEGCRPAL